MNAPTLRIFPNAEDVALQAARRIAELAKESVDARGRFTCAFSGGATPSLMLQRLAEQDLPWAAIHIFQVDERVVQQNDANRNFASLQNHLLKKVPVPSSQVHAMSVEDHDLVLAAAAYAKVLPASLDLVHLGLGEDGHTASLVPEDTLLEESQARVGISMRYRGYFRMTLTYPALAAAKRILWLVAGATKTSALRQLLNKDRTIPAGRVAQSNAEILADSAAAQASMS